MNGTELLCSLFASVPDLDENVTRVRGRIGGVEAEPCANITKASSQVNFS